MAKFLDENGVLYLWNKIKSFFVPKEDGKGLSSNDYTTDEKNKLAGITAGATKITVDASLSSTSTNPVQNKAVNTALGNKVDKVSGKQLSTEDYTSAEKTKLAGLQNYTLPTAGTSLGGVKTTSTVNSASGYTPCPIISGVVYYQFQSTPPRGGRPAEQAEKIAQFLFQSTPPRGGRQQNCLIKRMKKCGLQVNFDKIPFCIPAE